jgi:2-polyprenyl-3-methyl-5-hydroxy-6-metoxy-1,4-benzoquinol methylase
MKTDIHDYFKPVISHCFACGSEAIRPWLVKSKGPIQFNLWRCNICQTGFMNPQPKREHLEDIYHKTGYGLLAPISFDEVVKLETEYPNATVDSARLVGRAKSLLPVKDDLTALDIGSGFGFFSRAAVLAGFSVTAINPGAWENEIFEKVNGFPPLPHFFEEVDLDGKKFDLVILSQVLEHLEEPLIFLQKIASLLSPGGIIAIAVPNVDSILVKILKTRDNGCLWVPEHLTYFSGKGLATLLSRAGFVVKSHIYVSRIPYNSLSRKMNLAGAPRLIMNGLAKNLQEPPLKLINWLGLGFTHNIWGQATT